MDLVLKRKRGSEFFSEPRFLCLFITSGKLSAAAGFENPVGKVFGVEETLIDQ